MSVSIKITEKQHGKVRFGTTLVVTGKAGGNELFVGFQDSLLRLNVDAAAYAALDTGDKLYYHEGVLSDQPGDAAVKVASKPEQAAPVKSNPSKASMAGRFPQR